MKIKTVIIIATFTVLLCCKNETNIKNSSMRTAKTHEDKDSSEQKKVAIIKNNECFLLNDKKIDQ